MAIHNSADRVFCFSVPSLCVYQCIQSEKLLQPLVAALLLQRVPKPLYDLIVAKAPATPQAYRNLRNPTECAGNIDMFLPINELSSSDEAVDVTSEGGDARKKSSQAIEGTGEELFPPAGDQMKAHSVLSFEDRIRMLTTSVDALHRLGCSDEVDCMEGFHSWGEACQPRDSSSPVGTILGGASIRGQTEGNHIKWCHNPVQQYLLTLLDGCELAKRQCDVCFLMLAILLQSIFRHPSTTTVRLVCPLSLYHAGVERRAQYQHR